jgi:hypothetical protein
MSAPIICPWCGKTYDTHNGEICPVLNSSLTRMIAAATAIVMNERDEKAKALALSMAITPRMYPLTNVAGQEQMILGFNLNRGVAIVYNDDAADVFLCEDRQHANDATKRFVVKTKTALTFTSPAELWATGNAAGPQNLFVLELPPGRQASELATLAKLA